MFDFYSSFSEGSDKGAGIFNSLPIHFIIDFVDFFLYEEVGRKMFQLKIEDFVMCLFDSSKDLMKTFTDKKNIQILSKQNNFCVYNLL